MTDQSIKYCNKDLNYLIIGTLIQIAVFSSDDAKIKLVLHHNNDSQFNFEGNRALFKSSRFAHAFINECIYV